MKSRLPIEVLSKIWGLSDIDGDGGLDGDEFCVAMHLCHKSMAGEAAPDSLPPALIPPSKRFGVPAAADPFSAPAPAPAE